MDHFSPDFWELASKPIKVWTLFSLKNKNVIFMYVNNRNKTISDHF